MKLYRDKPKKDKEKKDSDYPNACMLARFLVRFQKAANQPCDLESHIPASALDTRRNIQNQRRTAVFIWCHFLGFEFQEHSRICEF